MTTATYEQKLRSPRWQKRRLRELNRATFACEACRNSEKELHIHHLNYTTDHPADVPDGWLEVLCCDCHKWREAWNLIFGRSLQPTKRLKAFVGSGLGTLIGYGDRLDFSEDGCLDELLGNFLRTLAGGNPALDADAIVQRHLRDLINRRRPIERSEYRALKAEAEHEIQ